MEQRSRQLGEENVGKLLLKFSIPAITGMLVNALYNIVDRLYVGNGVGALAISGIAIGYPITNIIMAFGMLVGIGTASLISIRLGQKKKEEAEQLLGNAFVLSIITSIIITVVGLAFLDQILINFGAAGDVLVYAREYSRIILIGVIFQNLAFSLNHSIRASGSPKIAMLSMVIGAVLNTILDPVFIYVFHMGVEGAAIATVISEAVSAVWVLSYFLRAKSPLKLQKKYLGLHSSTVLNILYMGIPSFFMQFAASVINIALNKSLLIYSGDIAVAAMGVISSISTVILMPIMGVNQGAQPIIGFNYGAKNYDRVKLSLKLAIFFATCISTFGFIIVELFPGALISLFGRSNTQLLEIGSHGIRIYLGMLPIVGAQIVSSHYFQAVGKPKHSIFLSLSRQVLILIPLLLILPPIFKLNGVWISGLVSDFISCVIAAVFVFVEMKHLDKLNKSKSVTA